MANRIKGQAICSACGRVGKPKKTVPGTFLMELVLWLCFIVPGLIYSVWRLSATKYACASCKKDALIPLDSPMGKELYAKVQAQQSVVALDEGNNMSASVVDELTKLAQLKDSGALTEEEFQSQKERLLAR